MLQKIIDSFYLRNIVILLIFLSPEILQSLAMYGGINPTHFFNRIFGYSCFYAYIVFHNRILYEFFLRKKKYFAYALLFILTLFIWRELNSYIAWIFTKTPSDAVYQIKELKNYGITFWITVYWANVVYIYILLGVYLCFKYFNERTRILQAENNRKELELKQLNDQLNPHFLFNALNNIYSHELRSSANSKELILKLSELMRYILDSSKKKTVCLFDELNFIENYMAFEKERLGERCVVTYTHSLRSKSFQIVPLILFNIIENAFKHGTASMNKSEIIIDLSADDSTLKLYVENDIWITAAFSTKTGLNNMIRRLDLLYKDAYKLTVSDKDGRYKTKLEICNIGKN